MPNSFSHCARAQRSRRRAIGAMVMLASTALGAACSGISDPVAPRSAPQRSALSLDATADVCSSPVNVPSSGTYCGVNTRIIPWAPADAYWGGATFQSDAGHGQSHDIAIFFDAPVASVEVTAYDPTMGGNAMYAYDASGATIGSAEFPGNGVPGVLTTQTRTISGSISEVKLIAATGDYLNYSMRVQYRGASIEIVEAKGPNDGSFLGRIPTDFRGASGDDMIALKAKTADPALESQVTWKVIDWPGDQVDTPVPSLVDPGLTSKFRVPAPDASRWAAPHPYQLAKTALAYEVRAVAGEYTSEPKTVRQDAMDAQRQEYIDLHVPQLMIPPRSSLGASPYYTHGDYATAVINANFDAKLAQLENNWQPHQFTVNGLYRNPGHNAFHVDSGSSSGTVSASWHQYGCGADMQVYPAHPSTARDSAAAVIFWDGLAQEARMLGFSVEQRNPSPAGQKKKPHSGIGHVHVELKCYR